MREHRVFPSLKLAWSACFAALWCAFWLGVAGLHAWLFVKRLWSGDWATSADQIRLVLALGGSLYGVYGTIKIRSIARRLQTEPRRVFAGLLIVLLGHLFVLDGKSDLSALDPETILPVAASVILLTVVIGLTLLASRIQPTMRTRSFASALCAIDPRLEFSLYRMPALFSRPPPRR